MFKLLRIILTGLVLLATPAAQGQSLPLFGDSGGNDKSQQSAPNVIEIDAGPLIAAYDRWKAELDAIAAEIAILEQADNRNSAEAERLARQIETVLSDADKAKSDANSALEGPATALAAIGSAPGSDQPPEADIIVEKRTDLERRSAYFNAQIAFVRLINAEAETLVERLALLTEKSFADWISSRDTISDLNIRSVTMAFSAMVTSLRVPDLSDWTGVGLEWHLAVSLALFVVMTLSFVVLAPRLAYWRENRSENEQPDNMGRSKAAFVLATRHGLLPSAICLSLAWFVLASHLLPPIAAILLVAVLAGGAFYLTVYRLCRTALAPYQPPWRMVELSDETAGRLDAGIRILSAVMALCISGYLVVVFAASAPGQAVLVLKLAGLVAISICALVFLRHSLWQAEDAKAKRERLLRLAFAIVIASLVAAGLSGYVNLAFFGLVHIAGTVLIMFCAYFARPILHNGLRAGFSENGPEFERDEQGALEIGLHIALDLSVALLFGLMLLGFWGLPLHVLWLWVGQIVSDISIGRLTLGLNDIVFAVLVFAAVLTFVRFVHRAIRNRFLARMSIERGIRDSIDVGLGYVGFIIAVMAAVAALGVSLSSIALLLGALSLGVGFGLQNIVDNFVSGLILLIQRPVKSGDWISVEGHEGLVQRIGVISTEISTFEEASVIVPNSELISSAVVNRTLGLSRGRVDVSVGVAYDSDIGQILDILRDCAQENEMVLEDPQPDVVMLNFDDSTLEFELRSFIADIRNTFTVASEIRIAILRAFRDKGIEIPFPQRDLHVKSASPDIFGAPAPGNGSADRDAPAPHVSTPDNADPNSE